MGTDAEVLFFILLSLLLLGAAFRVAVFFALRWLVRRGDPRRRPVRAAESSVPQEVG